MNKLQLAYKLVSLAIVLNYIFIYQFNLGGDSFVLSFFLVRPDASKNFPLWGRAKNAPFQKSVK